MNQSSGSSRYTLEALEVRMLLSADGAGDGVIPEAISAGSVAEVIEVADHFGERSVDRDGFDGHAADDLFAGLVENQECQDSAGDRSLESINASTSGTDGAPRIAPALPGLELVDPDVTKLAGQVFYLDVDGVSEVTYHGPVTVTGLDIPVFAAPGNLAGLEPEILAGVVDSLNHLFEGVSVTFTTRGPPESMDCSTIYVGGDDSRFREYGAFVGLAERVDVGNSLRAEQAFVFSDCLATRDPAAFSDALVRVIAHEAGCWVTATVRQQRHLRRRRPVRSTRWPRTPRKSTR